MTEVKIFMLAVVCTVSAEFHVEEGCSLSSLAVTIALLFIALDVIGIGRTAAVLLLEYSSGTSSMFPLITKTKNNVC